MTLFCKTFRKVSFNQVVGLQHLRVFIRARNDTMTLFLRKNHIHQHSDTLQQKTTQAEVYVQNEQTSGVKLRITTIRQLTSLFAYMILPQFGITECLIQYGKCNKMVMISLSDNDAWRRLRLTPLLSSSRFPAFSASKCLQNSSIIQNNSVTL